MELLEERILKEGQVLPGDILKVDSFLNHQIDTKLIDRLAEEFHRLFAQDGITKILTIEASGIALGYATAQKFANCPLVFAKKGQARNIGSDVYHASVHSYTRDEDLEIFVSKKYLHEDDCVLVIDDFLANGKALSALADIVHQAGARLAGCGVAIEKAYQPGGKLLRNQGIRVEALAKISAMNEDTILFE